MVRIGKYRVLGRLGRGGMAVVLTVEHEALGKVMALKLLRPSELNRDLIGLEELERWFMDEAALMASLDHENIASVWDCGREDGAMYMVMEYCSVNLGLLIGESMHVERPGRPLDPGRAMEYALQTLEGLHRLHQAGIVHRDVKPQNLMLTGFGRIKLIDMGLALVPGRKWKTHRAMKVGSAYYAAPEQEDDPDSVGPAADIYSLGVVLHRLLSGRLPQGPARPDRSLDWLPSWFEFLMQATALQPSKRFASARAMKDALQDLRHEWRRNQQSVCTLENESQSEQTGWSKPRSTPLRTGVRRSPEFVGLDHLLKPQKGRPKNHFIPTSHGMADKASGLEWGLKAPEYPLSMKEAESVLKAMNRMHDRPWRLPTVDELATVLRVPVFGSAFCVPDWLPHAAPWVWSADRRSHVHYWVADVRSGGVFPLEPTAGITLLPVRDLHLSVSE